jgi:hypothetical protein
VFVSVKDVAKHENEANDHRTMIAYKTRPTTSESMSSKTIARRRRKSVLRTDRQTLSSLEDTTESLEADVDLTNAEGKNSRVRASVSRLINLVRDYETEESVDDGSPNLAAEAATAGRQLFETVQRSEQNTELVNFREKRAESQQVEDKYLDVL